MILTSIHDAEGHQHRRSHCGLLLRIFQALIALVTSRRTVTGTGENSAGDRSQGCLLSWMLSG